MFLYLQTSNIPLQSIENGRSQIPSEKPVLCQATIDAFLHLPLTPEGEYFPTWAVPFRELKGERRQLSSEVLCLT